MVEGDIAIKLKAFIKQGENIQDTYEFVGKELGKGTYGCVMKGVHRITKAERAIKIIPKVKIRDMERFRTEVEIMRNADHPNIIKLFEWFEDQEDVYLVMEMCTGGELFDRIIDEGKFNETMAATYFAQMLRSIYYCHSKKICHRDLKPENFLFDSKDKWSPIKLIDFGLSKIYEDEESGKAVIMKTRAGTPYYIAPEVLEGSYDFSCDVWSLGVLLYVMLSGYPPFYGDTDPEIIQSVREGVFDFDGEEWEDVSDLAKSYICKMIALPKDRLTPNKALKHPWIKKYERRTKKARMSDAHVDQLTRFKACETLKKVTLTYIAHQLSPEERSQIRDIFLDMDENGDGTLSLDELAKGLGKVKTTQEVKDIMKAVDVDKSGKIDYNEFLAATLSETIYQDEDKILAAFNAFDEDKNGKISISELKKFIEGDDPTGYNENQWKAVIDEADIDKDGEIDFDEFMKMMYELKK